MYSVWADSMLAIKADRQAHAIHLLTAKSSTMLFSFNYKEKYI